MSATKGPKSDVYKVSVVKYVQRTGKLLLEQWQDNFSISASHFIQILRSKSLPSVDALHHYIKEFMAKVFFFIDEIMLLQNGMLFKEEQSKRHSKFLSDRVGGFDLPQKASATVKLTNASLHGIRQYLYKEAFGDEQEEVLSLEMETLASSLDGLFKFVKDTADDLWSNINGANNLKQFFFRTGSLTIRPNGNMNTVTYNTGSGAAKVKSDIVADGADSVLQQFQVDGRDLLVEMGTTDIRQAPNYSHLPTLEALKAAADEEANQRRALSESIAKRDSEKIAQKRKATALSGVAASIAADSSGLSMAQVVRMNSAAAVGISLVGSSAAAADGSSSSSSSNSSSALPPPAAAALTAALSSGAPMRDSALLAVIDSDSDAGEMASKRKSQKPLAIKRKNLSLLCDVDAEMEDSPVAQRTVNNTLRHLTAAEIAKDKADHLAFYEDDGSAKKPRKQRSSAKNKKKKGSPSFTPTKQTTSPSKTNESDGEASGSESSSANEEVKVKKAATAHLRRVQYEAIDTVNALLAYVDDVNFIAEHAEGVILRDMYGDDDGNDSDGAEVEDEVPELPPNSTAEAIERRKRNLAIVKTAKKMDENFKYELSNYLEGQLFEDIRFERMIIRYFIAKRKLQECLPDEKIEIKWRKVLRILGDDLKDRVKKSNTVNLAKMIAEDLDRTKNDETVGSYDAHQDRVALYTTSMVSFQRFTIKKILHIVNAAVNKICTHWAVLNGCEQMLAFGGACPGIKTMDVFANYISSSCGLFSTQRQLSQLQLDGSAHDYSMISGVDDTVENETNLDSLMSLVKASTSDHDEMKKLIIFTKICGKEKELPASDKLLGKAVAEAAAALIAKNTSAEAIGTPVSSKAGRQPAAGGDNISGWGAVAGSSGVVDLPATPSPSRGGLWGAIDATTTELLSVHATQIVPVLYGSTIKFAFRDLFEVLFGNILFKDANMCIEVNVSYNKKHIKHVSFLCFMVDLVTKDPVVTIHQAVAALKASVFYDMIECFFYVSSNDADGKLIKGDGYCAPRSLYATYMMQQVDSNGEYPTPTDISVNDAQLTTEDSPYRKGFQKFFHKLIKVLPDPLDKIKMEVAMFTFCYCSVNLVREAWLAIDVISYMHFNCTGFGHQHDNKTLNGFARFYCTSIVKGETIDKPIGPLISLCGIDKITAQKPSFVIHKIDHFFIADSPPQVEIRHSFDNQLKSIVSALLGRVHSVVHNKHDVDVAAMLTRLSVGSTVAAPIDLQGASSNSNLLPGVTKEVEVENIKLLTACLADDIKVYNDTNNIAVVETTNEADVKAIHKLKNVKPRVFKEGTTVAEKTIIELNDKVALLTLEMDNLKLMMRAQSEFEENQEFEEDEGKADDESAAGDSHEDGAETAVSGNTGAFGVISPIDTEQQTSMEQDPAATTPAHATSDDIDFGLSP